MASNFTFASRIQERAHDPDRARSIVHVDHTSRDSVGAIFTAVWARLVVAPPINNGSAKLFALHFLRDVHHLIERRRDQSAQADDVRLSLARSLQEFSPPAPSRRDRRLRSCYIAAPRPTMFLPMSCTSPFTVAMTIAALRFRARRIFPLP